MFAATILPSRKIGVKLQPASMGQYHLLHSLILRNKMAMNKTVGTSGVFSFVCDMGIL